MNTSPDIVDLVRRTTTDRDAAVFVTRVHGGPLVIQRSRQRIEANRAAIPTPTDDVIAVARPDMLVQDLEQEGRRPYLRMVSRPVVTPDEVLGTRRLAGGDLAVRLTAAAFDRVTASRSEAIRAVATTRGIDVVATRGLVSSDRTDLTDDEVRLTRLGEGEALLSQMRAGGLAANLDVEDVQRHGSPPPLSGPAAGSEWARLGIAEPMVIVDAETPGGRYRIIAGDADGRDLWIVGPGENAGRGSGLLRPATWRMQISGVSRVDGAGTAVALRFGITGVVSVQARYADGTIVDGWAAGNAGLLVLPRKRGVPESFEALDASGTVVATITPDDAVTLDLGGDAIRTTTGP